MNDIEHRIRRHWPYRMALRARSLQHGAEPRVVVSALQSFALDEPERLLTEAELWELAHDELGVRGMPDGAERLGGHARGTELPAREADVGQWAQDEAQPPLDLWNLTEKATLLSHGSERWRPQRLHGDARQQTASHFQAGEPVRLIDADAPEGMRDLTLPRWKVRGYASRHNQLEPLALRFDTVHLFPHRNRGIAIHRAALATSDLGASDIDALIVGIEAPDEAARGESYYRDALRQHGGERLRVMRYDGQLLPASMHAKQRCESCEHAQLDKAKLRASAGARSPQDGERWGGAEDEHWYCKQLDAQEFQRRGIHFAERRLPLLQHMGCDWGTPKTTANAGTAALTTAAMHPTSELGVAESAAALNPASLDVGHTPGVHHATSSASTAASVAHAIESPTAAPQSTVPPFIAPVRPEFERAGEAMSEMSSLEARHEAEQQARITGQQAPHLRDKSLQRPASEQREGDYLQAHLESGDFDCSRLQLQDLAGREAISELYDFTLDVVCNDPAGLALDDMVGSQAHLVVSWAQSGESARRIHGMIRKVEVQHDVNEDYHAYRLHLVPRAWRCSLNDTQEVFLDKSIIEIIQLKLARAGLFDTAEGTAVDVEFRLVNDYPVREFVVQYRESDWAFVARLAEHAGISFSFAQKDGVDRIVFSDHQHAFPQVDSIPLQKRGDRFNIYKLKEDRQVIPSGYEVHDYNYRTPLVQVNARHELKKAHYGSVVEYGGHQRSPEQGAALAKVRAQERQATRTVFRGESAVARLAAGQRFELDDSPLDEPSLLVTAIEHRFSQVVRLAMASDKSFDYHNSFVAVPAKHTYRPPRKTPRPRIHGLLTAVIEHDVTNGAEYWAKLDEQGRYTMRILFDTAVHEGDHHDNKQSRWTRMLQPHGGPNYGMHWPLKPGTEVALAFIDGDPDRPIVVGSVPNPVTPAPVNSSNHRLNKLTTVSGCHIEMYDAPEPPSPRNT